MIRLGLRLSLNGGREAALRVLVTAAAVALGVGLLLIALAGVNGLRAQTERGAWLDSSPARLACSPSCGARQVPSTSGSSASHPIWWLLTVEQFGNQAIDRVDVAATGPNEPAPPGIPRLPGPGQYYASPALTNLLRSVPANQLRDRFPGHEVGTIGDAALPSPSSLVVVIGYQARQLSQFPGAGEVERIQRTLADCYACESGVGSGPILQWILAGGAVALLLPVL
ncbi:MAG: ABC transporter permease, partial [Acidimicrobiales bacterium]